MLGKKFVCTRSRLRSQVGDEPLKLQGTQKDTFYSFYSFYSFYGGC